VNETRDNIDYYFLFGNEMTTVSQIDQSSLAPTILSINCAQLSIEITKQTKEKKKNLPPSDLSDKM
jgi:hypothetical protein